MQRSDRPGRIAGLTVFLVGVGILIFVAVVAYSFFTSSISQPPIAAAKDSTVPATVRLAREALTLLFRVVLLIVLTIVGSLVAGRGIQLYYASAAAVEQSNPNNASLQDG